jgi:hypothetical protein
LPEDHVRKPWLGIDQADINRQLFFEKAAQRVPLLLRVGDRSGAPGSSKG